jgi:hypothetical protein
MVEYHRVGTRRHGTRDVSQFFQRGTRPSSGMAAELYSTAELLQEKNEFGYFFLKIERSTASAIAL